MTVTTPSLSISPETLDCLQHNNQIAIIRLTTTVLICEGPDAQSFLQGQLTCDLNRLESSSSINPTLVIANLGSCCTPQGRMTGLFYIAKFSSECFWLFLSESNAETVAQHLGKYSIFSKLSLQLNPDGLKIFGLIAHDFALIPTLIPTLPTDTQFININNTKNTALYYLVTPAATVVSNHPLINLQNSIQELHQGYWKLSMLLLGIPEFDSTLEGQFMPSDLHLDDMDGVSYNKGCYTGQEPIARLHFKGTPKFSCRLLAWETEQEPEELLSDVLLDDKKIGKLVQTIQLSNGRWIGLARLRIDALRQISLYKSQIQLANWSRPAVFINIAYNQERDAKTMA